jgi:GT2 family glycosyltransferase
MELSLKHKPGISVVVSTFNRVESAVRLVRQLVSQADFQGSLEILLVNDAGDPAVLEHGQKIEHCELIPIRCFDTGYDGYGLVIARNTGLRFADCDHVVFLDDDMEVGPDLIARYQRAPAGVRLGRIDFRVEVDGKTQIYPDRREIMNGPDRLITPFEPYLGNLWGGNCCISTSLALALGGFDEAYLEEGEEDVDFGFRAILACGNLVAVPSARAVHTGPDMYLARQLGLSRKARISRAHKRLAQTKNLIANGGLDYWARRQWEERPR